MVPFLSFDVGSKVQKESSTRAGTIVDSWNSARHKNSRISTVLV